MPPVNTTIQCWVCEGFVLRSCLNWRLSVICWWRIVLWRVLMKDRIKYWREPKLQDLCITYKTESSTESAQINRALLRSSPRLAFFPSAQKSPRTCAVESIRPWCEHLRVREQKEGPSAAVAVLQLFIALTRFALMNLSCIVVEARKPACICMHFTSNESNGSSCSRLGHCRGPMIFSWWPTQPKNQPTGRSIRIAMDVVTTTIRLEALPWFDMHVSWVHPGHPARDVFL